MFDEIQNPTNQTLLKQLITTLQKYDVKIGVSVAFSNLLHTRIYRKQAEIASSLSKNGQCIYFSSHVLEAIKLVLEDTKHIYIHPAFEILKAFDQKNKTEYYPTLRSYLSHFGKHNEIEEDLKIHRNTVRNRLSNIEKMTSISLEDPYTFTHLYISYILLSHCA